MEASWPEEEVVGEMVGVGALVDWPQLEMVMRRRMVILRGCMLSVLLHLLLLLRLHRLYFHPGGSRGATINKKNRSDQYRSVRVLLDQWPKNERERLVEEKGWGYEERRRNNPSLLLPYHHRSFL
jgi:hypothetical protein